METNPLIPQPIEFVLLTTFLLGVACTIMAIRYASKGEMRPAGAVTVGLLNLLPVIGPLAAASGMFWHHQRRTSK